MSDMTSTDSPSADAPAAGTGPDRAATMDVVVRAVVATAAWGVVHSLLASEAAKRAAARLVGEREARTWYRVAFNTQAVLTTAALTVYLWRHRGETAYELHGPARAAVRLGQLAAVGYVLWAATNVGLGELSGFRHVAARLAGDALPPIPAGQGPTVAGQPGVVASGPFAHSRNPLNMATVPVLWLAPKASVARVAFNAAATVYLVVGSWHAERMQVARRRAEMDAYRQSGVPFFLPRLGGGAREAGPTG